MGKRTYRTTRWYLEEALLQNMLASISQRSWDRVVNSSRDQFYKEQIIQSIGLYTTSTRIWSYPSITWRTSIRWSSCSRRHLRRCSIRSIIWIIQTDSRKFVESTCWSINPWASTRFRTSTTTKTHRFQTRWRCYGMENLSSIKTRKMGWSWSLC